MLGMTGLIAFTTGMLGILVLSVLWVLSRQFDAWPDVHLTERAIFFYCLGAALLGAQMMSIGFLAELMTAYLGNESDNYSVAERVGSEAIGGQGPEPTGRRISAGQIRTEPAVGSVGVPHLKKQPSHEPSQTDDGNAADLS